MWFYSARCKTDKKILDCWILDHWDICQNLKLPVDAVRVAGFVRQVSRFSSTVHVCRLLGCAHYVTVLTFSIQNCFKKCTERKKNSSVHLEIKSLSPTINSHPLLLLSNAHEKTLKYYRTFKYVHVMQFSLCPHHFACLQLRNGIKVGLTLITVKNINFYWLNNIKRLTTKLNTTQWMESQKARLWTSSWFSTFTLWLPLFHRKE